MSEQNAPHPRFVEFVEQLIERHGGVLNAHREAVEIRDIFAEYPENPLYRYWQAVADEITRQACTRVDRDRQARGL